jgi:hypothetical protein
MPINRDLIERSIEAALVATAAEAGREFTRAITENIWDWPRTIYRPHAAPPERRSPVEPPINIVDTGALRASQTETFRGRVDANTLRAEFAWNINYAAPVHEGAVFRSGATLPARPWTRVAMRRFNAEAFYARAFKGAIALGGNGL